MSWNSAVFTLRCKQYLKNNFKINAQQLNCTHTKLQARLEKEFQNLDPPTTQWTSVPVIACAVCTQLYFAGAAADVPIWSISRINWIWKCQPQLKHDIRLSDRSYWKVQNVSKVGFHLGIIHYCSFKGCNPRLFSVSDMHLLSMQCHNNLSGMQI